MPQSEPQCTSRVEAPVTRPHIAVVIPALNEQDTIADVVCGIPSSLVDEVIVVDNGSTDATVERARLAGAKVVAERKRGYGRACRAGTQATTGPGILVF